MTDNLSKEKRNKVMRKIASKNTKPELIVRSLLHKMGYRFRLQRSDLPGPPDIALPRFKTAIFVHGCYWHRRVGCKFSTWPKSNRLFWKNKFAHNVSRDTRVQSELEDLGWNVVIVWECELRDLSLLRKRMFEELTLANLMP